MDHKKSHKMSVDTEEAETLLNQQTYRETEYDVEMATPGTSGATENLEARATPTTSLDYKDQIDRTSEYISARSWLLRNESEVEKRVQVCSGVPIEEEESQDNDFFLEAPLVDNEFNELNSQLLHAIINQDNVEVERLLNENASPNATCRAKNTSGQTIIHYCENYTESVVKLKPEWTLLHIASFAGYSSSTRLLLDAGANPNIIDKKGDTPLAIAGEAFILNSYIVDKDSYLETIEILLEHRRTNYNPLETSPRELVSALVTAVSLSCEEAVKLLLQAEAPVIQHNRHGNTPLHECVRTRNENILQLLAEYLAPEPGQAYPPLDVKYDDKGYTVLQTAVLASWLLGVCFALNFKADVNHKAKDGFTAIHLAARKGNLEILNLILENVEKVVVGNDGNDNVENPLICAIRSGNLDCVKALIEKKATLQYNPPPRHILSDTNITEIKKFLIYHEKDSARDVSLWIYITRNKKIDNNMILHAAWIQTTEDEFVKILEYLLDKEESLQDLLDYRCPDLKYMIPLEVAAFEKKPHIYKFLLQKSIDWAAMKNKKFDPIILWLIFDAMLASRKNLKAIEGMICMEHINEVMKNKIKKYNEVLQNTIHVFPKVVHILPRGGTYILHAAIEYNEREMILLQLNHGADLSVRNHHNKTALSLLMRLSNPVEFITNIFDDRVEYPTNFKDTFASMVTFDYSVLAPTMDIYQDEGQMKVLKALIETGNYKGQKELLMHPLVESFLYQKWQAYTIYFCSIIFIYICIALLLSTLFVSVFYFNDQEKSTRDNQQASVWFSRTLYCITIVLLIFIVSQELSFIDTGNCLKHRPSCATVLECFVKCGSYLLTIVTPLIIIMQSEITEWWRYLAAITLILVWSNLMLWLSKTPTAGYYMQMFWSVSLKIFKILSTFVSLIIMFTACFMVLSHNKAPFDGPYAAVIKTLVMMTSEFDYEDNFSKTKPGDVVATVMILRFVFAIFLIVTAIVLMNLMTGVAVSDINDLIYKGNLRRLEKQIELLYALEVSRKNKSVFRILSLHKYVNSDIGRLKQHIHCYEKKFNDDITERITKKAQKKIKKAEKKRKSDELKETLDKLLQITSKNEENIQNNTVTNKQIKDMLNGIFDVFLRKKT